MTWSDENRSQLIRVPAAVGEQRRAELRSADVTANPYLAYALLIYAGLYGIEKGLVLPPASDINLYTAPAEILQNPAGTPGLSGGGRCPGRHQCVRPGASAGLRTQRF